jgi:hypothetical protein
LSHVRVRSHSTRETSKEHLGTRKGESFGDLGYLTSVAETTSVAEAGISSNILVLRNCRASFAVLNSRLLATWSLAPFGRIRFTTFFASKWSSIGVLFWRY